MSSETPPSRRWAERVVWTLLALTLLLGSGIASFRAPFGVWANLIFGQVVWNESDPGAFYFPAAHELEWGEPAHFVGHPGTTLMLLLRGVQEIYYWAAAPADLSFSAFIARHLATAYALSKLAITLLHLLSFRLLFLFARELVRSRSAAVFATLGYASSLPVLYYLSRISTEPLLTICFCGAFLAIWRYEALARAGHDGRALGWVGIAALAAISGAFSKLHFLAPLTPFLGLYLLCAGRTDPEALRIPGRIRRLALLTLLGASAALVALYSQWMGWGAFADAWWRIGTHGGLPRGWVFTPTTPHGVFLLCELPFVALAVAGFVLFLRRGARPDARVAWTSLYGAYALLLFVYRIYVEQSMLPFHYFFLANGIFAVYFGVATQWLFRRLSIPETGARAALLGLAWVGLVHGVAVFAVLQSRLHDVEQYAQNRPLFELIAGLEAQQRIANLGLPPGISAPAPLVIATPPFEDVHYRIATEFEALFAPVDAGRLRTERVYVVGQGAEFGVVDLAEAAP